jgi:hypothetical protein
VGQQNRIDPRQIRNPQSRPPLPPQNNQPRSEHGIYQQPSPRRLNQKRRVTDKRDGRLTRFYLQRHRLRPAQRLRMTLAYQLPKLLQFLTQKGISIFISTLQRTL